MKSRSLLFAVAVLICIPAFAQTDISGTWTGTVNITENQSGCPPLSLNGNATLTATQNGTSVSGLITSSVSINPFAPGCPADAGPISLQYSGNVNPDNTVSISALGQTGTLTVQGNAMSGMLTGTGATITVLLVKQGAVSSGSCNLGITLNCNGGNCTAVTTNNGSSTCSGEYITGILIEDPQNRGTVSNMHSTPALDECFDNGSLQGIGTGIGVCVGESFALAPGATLTTGATVNLAGADASSILAATIVEDATSGSTLAEVYTFQGSGVPTPTCTPIASVPSVAQSGNSYNVTWTAVTEPNATYTVEESTKPDFSTITNSKQTNSLSATFTNSPGTTTTYYYRVRANVCSGAPGANSATVFIVVQAIPTAAATSRQVDVPTPLGSTTPVKINVQIAGQSQPVSFTATVDKPYLSVSPSSGTLPTSGMTLTVTANPTNLPPGANSGTLTVTTSSSGKGGPVTNDNTSSTKTVSVSLVTPVGPGGKTLPPPNTLIIPAVAHAPGALGPFQSDIRLTNAGGASTQYQITYTPQATDATQSSKTTTITVDSLQTIALNDVLRDFFGVGATDQAGDAGQGSLEIRPLNNSSLLNYASSRTFTFNSRGTFGQFIAAIPFSTFATKASVVPFPGQPAPTGTPTLSLQQVAQSPAFRTNLGIAEGSGSPASGNIRLFNSLGGLLASVPYSLRAGEQQQKSFAGWGLPNVDDGRIEVTVESSTGAVTAYASVLDNNTNDPLEVTPVQVSQVSSSSYTLPGMATLNNGATNFHSDVRLYNGGGTSVTVTPTYYPQGGGAPVPAAAFSVGSGQEQAFNDIVATLFKQTNSGGSIVFATSSPSSLVATGRTYTIDPTANNGTYGQFIPGVMPSQGIANGDKPLQILQLEQSANFRSNVAVFELTGNAATAHITGYLPDSKTTVSTDVPLAANQFVQFPLASMFPGQNVYNVRVSVAVTGGSGRVSAYGSVIDNASTDPTFVPAQ